MKTVTRIAKEDNILRAAELVFSRLGFKNAKMEDVAQEAGITKVTLYAYFQSKENLYMAITHNALLKLIELYESTIIENKATSGLESTLAVVKCYMDFCEDYPIYAETLLDYFAMIRSTSSGEDLDKIPEALHESSYLPKVMLVQNTPFIMAAKEIERGKQDGSIATAIDPMLATLHGWTLVVGYSKIVSASGDNISPLLNVNLQDLKSLNISIVRNLLKGGITMEQS